MKILPNILSSHKMNYPAFVFNPQRELQLLKTAVEVQSSIITGMRTQINEQTSKINELINTVNALNSAMQNLAKKQSEYESNLTSSNTPAKRKRLSKKELEQQALAGIKSEPFVVNVSPVTLQ